MIDSKITNTIVDETHAYFDKLIAYLPRFGIGIAVLVIGVFIAIKFGSFLSHRLARRVRDKLLADFIGRFVRSVIVLVSLALTLRVMGLGDIAGSLVAGAGITAFVVGFAFKDIGENFLSGIILAFKRPFRIGDTIECSDITGTVQKLDMRTTHLKTAEGTDVYMPNSILIKNALSNHTRGGSMRNSFSIGINYRDDFDLARQTIIQSIKNLEGLSDKKGPAVTIDELGSDRVTLKVYYWVDLRDFKGDTLYLKGLVMETVKKALMNKGFGMPVPSPEAKAEEKMEEVKKEIKEPPGTGHYSDL
jgi:small-conductance mechanosensitive channel